MLRKNAVTNRLIVTEQLFERHLDLPHFRKVFKAAKVIDTVLEVPGTRM